MSKMIRTYTVDETRKYIKEWKINGDTIGLVPTMGYLHEGHASLVKRARKENDRRRNNQANLRQGASRCQ